MKKYILLLIVTLVSVSCNGQNKESEKAIIKEKQPTLDYQPKGSWKVDKEFDENGNLIRYDSIYSWSSDSSLENISPFERDSLMKSLKSRFFTNFSKFEKEGFEDVFAQDSLFSKRFFNDDFFGSDFGKDFMNIDKIREEMIARQKKFLEKYQSEFKNLEKEN
jgi:hypothetical protein